MNNVKFDQNVPDVLFDLVLDIQNNLDLNKVITEYAGLGEPDDISTRYRSPFVDDDDDRSLYVHNDRKYWKCFKTGAGGNVIEFLTYIAYGLEPNFNNYITALNQIISDYNYNLNYER